MNIVFFVIYHAILIGVVTMVIRDTNSFWTGFAVLVLGVRVFDIGRTTALLKAMVRQLYVDVRYGRRAP